MEKGKYVSSITDLKYKKKLLTELYKDNLDNDIKHYEQTGEVRKSLKYIHDVSLAEMLFNMFGITEWDKKSISLEDNEKDFLFTILSKLLYNYELSPKEIELFKLVKSPYPDFIRDYYKKYIEQAQEGDIILFNDKTFPFKMYISTDGQTRLIDSYLKQKVIKNVDQFIALSDLREKLSDYFGCTSHQSEVQTLERLLYILRYADEEILKEAFYSGGDLNDKINIYNMPLRNILKLAIGTTNGGHSNSIDKTTKDYSINTSLIASKQGLDYLYQLYRKPRAELLAIHNIDEETFQAQDSDEFNVVNNITLPKSKEGMLSNNLRMAHNYYYNMMSEEDKSILEEFATQEKTKKIRKSRIIQLIVAYLYMTKDLNKLERIFSFGNFSGFSKSLCQSIIDDYNKYVASIKASKEESEKALK